MMPPRSKRLDGIHVAVLEDQYAVFDQDGVIHDPVNAALIDEAEPVEDDLDDLGDDDLGALPFDANLAEALEDDTLSAVATELLDGFEEDLKSREEWEKDLAKGLKMLGVKLEELDKPFKGACSATMPIIEENARAFQARALQAMFPPEGPVQTRVYGVRNEQSDEIGGRVRAFMNWQLTEQMPEYFADTDQMLYYMALAGSAFRKLWRNDLLMRPEARFLKVDDFVVNYGAANLAAAERATHVFTLTRAQYNRMVMAGAYRQADLTPREVEPQRPVAEAVDAVTGQDAPPTDAAGVGDSYTFLEVCCWRTDLDVSPEAVEPGMEIAFPYVVTLEKESRQVVAVRRNWQEGDPANTPVQHYVHYKFMPGLGFYGQGYIQLLGNLQKTATTSMRALVDAGQFSNLPGGFKTRGLRIANDGGDQAVGFGEWLEVENYGERIQDSVMPLPYKEPSQTLLALLNGMVETSRRLGAVVDVDMGSIGTKETPVGTASMMLEQNMSQLGAVYQRLHRSQSEEFRILRRLNMELTSEGYPFPVDGGEAAVFAQDFAAVQIMPVADPAAFSEAQRIVKAQAIQQIAQQFPDVLSRQGAVRTILRSLNLGSETMQELLPNRGEPDPMDPATEFYAILMGRPTKAFPAQNHQAHMAFLAAKKMDPATAQAAGNPQAAQVLMSRIDAAIGQHLAYMQRQEIEAMTGVQLPPAPDYRITDPADEGEYDLPEQAAYNVAAVQAQAAQQLAQQRQQMAQAQQNAAMNQDPRVQADKAKAQAALMKAQADVAGAQAQAQIDAARTQVDNAVAMREAARAERETDAKIANMAADNRRADRELANEERAGAQQPPNRRT